MNELSYSAEKGVISSKCTTCKHTFSRFETDTLAVGTLSLSVVAFHSGIIKTIEMQTVYAADKLWSAIHFL